ncbi:MAG: hypothetical protein EZS28_019896 [Streblomastix strix]|uniref:Uncharacterized protein n=1 Tax=Streblomastix strix TaxID=222440 RepID=A0A5J4VPZ7_9EUKA|nr:MAG: hypothetical protein EZS28_019896 [Streblomastix strix]
MYYVNVDHGTDESTIDEPFNAEDVPLIEPREFLVMGWSAIETSRIEKNIIKGSSIDTISVVYTISPDERRIPTFHNSAAKQITSFQPKGGAFVKVSGPCSFNNYMF